MSLIFPRMMSSISEDYAYDFQFCVHVFIRWTLVQGPPHLIIKRELVFGFLCSGRHICLFLHGMGRPQVRDFCIEMALGIDMWWLHFTHLVSIPDGMEGR